MGDILKNREAVQAPSRADVSKERLEEIFKKTIDDGYVSVPTNDKYVVTQEKPRGKVTFPLILITSSLSQDIFKKAIADALMKVPSIGEQVTVLYKNKSSNKATFLCTTYGNKESIETLKQFCVQFKYYIAKGVQRTDLSFDELIDLKSVGADIIIDTEEVEDYIPDYRKEVIKDNSCSKYKEIIENILNKRQTKNEIDQLINPSSPTEEIPENQENYIQEPTPISEQESTIQVNKW